jgi:peroxiredoxin
MLKAGEKVPSFAVTDSLGNPVTEALFAGRRTLLFFYPKASTSG